MAPASKRARCKKKALVCGRLDREIRNAGRQVYNGRCYFCHGYRGDGNTRAARHLVPPPGDFTRVPGLNAGRILEVVRSGRPNTAMMAYAGLMSEAELRAVVAFIEEEFVRCRATNTVYHTVANGWPGHNARNGAAFPFVDGTLPADAAPDGLTADQSYGLEIFRESCISCHEGRSSKSTDSGGTSLTPGLSSGPVAGALGKDESTQKKSQYTAGNDDHDEDCEYASNEYAARNESCGAGKYEQAEMIKAARLELTRAARLYDENCALCHADDGSGANFIGRFLHPHPPDFTSVETAARLNDARLRTSIVDGLPGTSMPAFRSTLSGDQVEDIIAYMRRAFFR